MAYSEKDLSTEWIPQVRFPDGNNVNLMTVREAIENEAAATAFQLLSEKISLR